MDAVAAVDVRSAYWLVPVHPENIYGCMRGVVHGIRRLLVDIASCPLAFARHQIFGATARLLECLPRSPISPSRLLVDTEAMVLRHSQRKVIELIEFKELIRTWLGKGSCMQAKRAAVPGWQAAACVQGRQAWPGLLKESVNLNCYSCGAGRSIIRFITTFV